MTDQFPHSRDAEEAVLGSILINPDVYYDVAQVLSPDDFYIQKHVWLFEAFERLNSKRSSVDHLTVQDELERRGKLGEIGGPAYLTSLVNQVGMSLNATDYAKIVLGESLRRKMIRASHDSLQLAVNKELEADEALLKAHEAFDAITPAYKPHTSPLGDRILAAYIDASEKGDMPGIPTGLVGLDKILGGYMDTDFVLIGGRPGEGKSGMLITSMRAALRDGRKPALFSLEMGDLSVGQRLIAQEKTLNTFRIRRGRLDPDELEQLRQGTEWLNLLEHEHRLLIDEKPSVTTAYIHAVCKRLKSRGLLDIVFVDYVQLMTGAGKTLYEQVTDVSKGLKKIAKDLDVPVVAAAQLKRDAEGRRPNKSDLKESGSLEQDADVVIFIWRDGEAVSNNDIDLSIRMSVAKHRNGPTGDLTYNGESTVQYRKSCTRFEDIQI